MDDARINRRAPEADDHQPNDHAKVVRQWHEHGEDAGEHQHLTEANHDRVLESHGQKAGKRTPHGDAYIE